MTRGARIVRALSVAFVALQSVACGTAGSPSASLAGVALPSLPAGSSWLAFALDGDGGWDFDGGDADIYLVDDRGDHRIRLTDRGGRPAGLVAGRQPNRLHGHPRAADQRVPVLRRYRRGSRRWLRGRDTDL